MQHAAKSFCDRINIKYCDEIVPFYKKGVGLYKEKGLLAVSKERLIKLNNEYNLFRNWLCDILAACDAVAQDEDLVLFVYTLIALIEENGNLDILQMPDRERMDTDFAPLFSVMYFLESMIESMEKRGLPREIISDTAAGFDTEINDYYGIFKRSGGRIYVPWFMLFVKNEILRIGRFQFQITKLPDKIRVYKKDEDVKILIDGDFVHRKGMLFGSSGQDDKEGRFFAEITETEEGISGYAADEYGNCIPDRITLCGYEEVLRAGDCVLSVHIPSDAPLNIDECEKSYEKAKRIFKEFYPEYKFKAFYCYSWLLEKKLKDIMGRETNITRFADKYKTYPVVSQGRDVYQFLYALPEPVPPERLPEKSSMHRLVKQYLAQGNVFYEKSGIILI